ncbi:MAG: nucleoside triphosphate pyrophosphohydrolase [Pseudomonadota bacterium]
MTGPKPLDSLDPTEAHRAAGTAFANLLAIMARLRSQDGGCPWDIEQDFASIAPYTIEEAYEVADAIERGDSNDLKSELGDLLFQVVFHSQMAAEEQSFTASDVAEAITNKMLERHPHVFAAQDGRTADAQKTAWEDMKAAERQAAQGNNQSVSAVDGVALALPALMRAEKLQKRAARVGFDWTQPEPIFEKLMEETAEVRAALICNDRENLEEEVGDLLFVVANLSRRLRIDPEIALRKANAKFERRFKRMETLASERGERFASLDLDQQEALWQRVKAEEREAVAQTPGAGSKGTRSEQNYKV